MIVGMLKICDLFTLPATGDRFKFIIIAAGTVTTTKTVGRAWCYNLTKGKMENLKRSTEVIDVEHAD